MKRILLVSSSLTEFYVQVKISDQLTHDTCAPFFISETVIENTNHCIKMTANIE
jgi:hypothetical protein